jgi:hypothetical protein
MRILSELSVRLTIMREQSLILSLFVGMAKSKPLRYFCGFNSKRTMIKKRHSYLSQLSFGMHSISRNIFSPVSLRTIWNFCLWNNNMLKI